MEELSDFTLVLVFLEETFNKIINIQMPWFNLTFGQILIGPLFIGLIIGLFRIVFTSVSNGGGDKSD